MRRFVQLALGMAIAATLFGQSAYAQSGAVYLATYVDVMPNSVASGAALLKHYRDASLKADGNLRRRPGHLQSLQRSQSERDAG